MNETKIKQRFEKAFSAFCNDENPVENKFPSRADDAELRQNETKYLIADTFKSLIGQIILFFPGTFVLFGLSFAFTVISVHNPFQLCRPIV